MKMKTMHGIILGMVLLVTVQTSCVTIGGKISSDYCETKYPVILVHGLGFRDMTVFVKYWGKIPDVLKQNGAMVYTSRQEAYGSIEENAGLLKKQIRTIMELTGSPKVNIIAHSRGGIESRYMISKLGMSAHVASLTTISTPHRGSSMADIVMKRLKDENVLTMVIDFYAKIIGDKTPESYDSGNTLTRGVMKTFNEQVPDIPSVYYQSYAGQIGDSIINPLWKGMYESIKKYEGENDGLVSVESAKWGAFRGVMLCDGKANVSHADEVGMNFLSDFSGFNAPAFYKEVVHELTGMGF